jgi:hypothetical protein
VPHATSRHGGNAQLLATETEITKGSRCREESKRTRAVRQTCIQRIPAHRRGYRIHKWNGTNFVHLPVQMTPQLASSTLTFTQESLLTRFESPTQFTRALWERAVERLRCDARVKAFAADPLTTL